MILYFTGMGNEGGFAEVLYFFHCIDPNETKDEDDNSDHVNDSSDESTRGNKGRCMGSYTTPQSHLLAMVRCINAEQSRGFFNRKPGKASTGKKNSHRCLIYTRYDRFHCRSRLRNYGMSRIHIYIIVIIIYRIGLSSSSCI